MKTSLIPIFALFFMGLNPVAAPAQDTPEMAATALWEQDRTQVFDASGINLNDFVWLARPVVVFADTPNDPQFKHQMDLLTARIEALADRDVIVITDTDPAARSDIRQKLRPRGFMLVLVDKDGRVALRKPAPWDVRELSRSIDSSPLRQQEIADRRISQ